MKIFGIRFEARKEPRWASFEDVAELSRFANDIAEGVERNRKAIEANKARILRAKLPDSEAEALLNNKESPHALAYRDLERLLRGG